MKIGIATTIVAACLAGAVTATNVGARHKPSEVERSRSCRTATAKNSRLMIRYDLSALDGCHHRSNRGEQTGDCNALANPDAAQTACPSAMVPGGDQASIEQACQGVLRANSGIAAGFACQATSPVLLNYPADAVEGGVLLATNVLGPAFLSTVGTSGVELQGPSASSTGKAARRCKDAIGRVRSKIVKHVVATATACQKKIDRHSTTFAAIDPSCLAKARGAFPEDVSHLRKACRGIAGADVGSCADLPGCVRDFAVATGESLARTIYGGARVCGNGVVELGEECDDGNADNTDACTTTCTPAVCGDGFVQAGVEECDDGNQFQTDGCLNDCKVPACGDGMVNGEEECDDGNDDPNDGCADCKNALTCTGGIVTATLQMVDSTQPPGTSRPLAGFRLDLGYPAGLSIPGSGLETDSERLVTLGSGNPTTVFFDRDDNEDGTDDTVRIVYALSGGRTVSAVDPFAEVHFDCAPGTPLSLDSLSCGVLDAADPVGTSFSGGFECKVVSLH